MGDARVCRILLKRIFGKLGSEHVDSFNVCQKASADEGGGEAGTNYRGPGPGCVAYVFVFLGIGVDCRPYKLTVTHQAQVTL